MTALRFDLYGRFELELVQTDAGWRAYRTGNGLRTPVTDCIIPPQTTIGELPKVLDDIYHEWARPGTAVRRVS